MGWKRRLYEGVNSWLERYGFKLMKSQMLYEWQKNPPTFPSYRPSQLPQGSESYLIPSNSRFQELKARYSAFDGAVTTPFVWTDDMVRLNDMLYFRGDNAYVWQIRGFNMNVLSYALMTYYVKSIDKLGLLEKPKEDDLFGVYSFEVDNKLVSRDLLDSIIEIHFLEKHLHISTHNNLRILDIGAGYGRLAYRMVNALANIEQFLCTDAVPVSTFICEYYLRFRKLEDKAKAVPIDEIEQTLEQSPVDLAINIQSFPECKISAIEWWLSFLAKHRVKNLMIVLDYPELRTHEGLDFGNLVKTYGYRLVVKESTCQDKVVQQYTVNPSYLHLFQYDR
jgi:hypothetical protein